MFRIGDRVRVINPTRGSYKDMGFVVSCSPDFSDYEFSVEIENTQGKYGEPTTVLYYNSSDLELDKPYVINQILSEL